MPLLYIIHKKSEFWLKVPQIVFVAVRLVQVRQLNSYSHYLKHHSQIQLFEFKKLFSGGCWGKLLSIFIGNAHSPKRDGKSCQLLLSPVLIVRTLFSYRQILFVNRGIVRAAKRWFRLLPPHSNLIAILTASDFLTGASDSHYTTVLNNR